MELDCADEKVAQCGAQTNTDELYLSVGPISSARNSSREVFGHALDPQLFRGAQTNRVTTRWRAALRRTHSSVGQSPIGSKAQFYLDFVEAENSTGFHAPQEAARILGESVDFSRRGQIALRDGKGEGRAK